ncbi:MAG: ATP-binding protein, partial [Jiangellaceae bacterium]
READLRAHDPSLIVTVVHTQRAGKTLTVIQVPRSPEIHQVRGRASERVGTACQPMNSSRIAQVLEDRRGDDWSAKDAGVPVAQISPVAEEMMRTRLRGTPDAERQSWADISIHDVCRRLGVISPTGTLTNAGVMLLVDTGHAHIDYTHRVPTGGLLSANERLSGSGLWALLRLLELIEGRTDRSAIVLPSGTQLFIADLPEQAVREAVVNAVMHRDYRVPGTIQVEHASAKLRVTSPGGFVVGVSPANVLTVSSRTRNPALAGAIRGLNLGEAAGVGVDRMYAAMTSAGHRPPVFESDGGRVTASLLGGAPNEPFARFVAALPDERRADPDTLLVLTSLLRNRTVTAATMAPLMQKSEDETEAVLMALSAPGTALIERTIKSARSRQGTYRLQGHIVAALGAAVTYRSRSGDDTDRKVIDVVRELGQINGRVVQSMLDVQPATASRVLSDLVDREILVKTSKAQRGPSVTYGPGHKFPHARFGRVPRRRQEKEEN